MWPHPPSAPCRDQAPLFAGPAQLRPTRSAHVNVEMNPPVWRASCFASHAGEAQQGCRGGSGVVYA